MGVSTREVVGTAGDGIQIEIGDTGTGIQPEHLTRIFEPFFTTKGDVGTGIGLWVTKRLVEARGGKISVVSSIVKGSGGTTVPTFLPFAMPNFAEQTT